MYGYLIDNLDIYIEIIDLARQNGKTAGMPIKEEFEIIRNKYPEKFRFIGELPGDDMDMVAGNLRENGLNVININEVKEKNAT